MTDNQIKQAYVTGLAARGILRQMVKQAVEKAKDAPAKEPTPAGPGAFGFRDYAGDAAYAPGKKRSFGMDMAEDYLQYGGAGAGIGAIIGALIQIARQKSVMTGALVGAGVGGGVGLAHRGLRHIPGYRDSDLNLLDKLVFDPIAQKEVGIRYGDK